MPSSKFARRQAIACELKVVKREERERKGGREKN
jgi:hypothetical protein